MENVNICLQMEAPVNSRMYMKANFLENFNFGKKNRCFSWALINLHHAIFYLCGYVTHFSEKGIILYYMLHANLDAIQPGIEQVNFCNGLYVSLVTVQR